MGSKSNFVVGVLTTLTALVILRFITTHSEMIRKLTTQPE